MASTSSFSLPVHTIHPRFSASPPPSRQSLLRLSSAGPNTASLYDVLGIEISASSQEIKSAYRRLARVLHPDAASCTGRDSSTAEEFIRLLAAYSTLSDPEKRAVYDGSILRQRHRPVTLSARDCSAVAWRRRNWETDQCW